MFRVLLNPWGSLGDLHPFLALGLALKDQGAIVTVASMSQYESLVRAQGLGFVSVGPHFSPGDALIRGALSDPRFGTQRLFTDLVIPALPESYAEIEASVTQHDVVVTCPAALAAMIASEKHHKIWVGTALAPVAFFWRYDPPMLPICPLLSQFAQLSPLGGAILRGAIKRLASRLMNSVSSFRKSLALNSAQNLLVDAYSPYLNLAMFDDAFGVWQPDWPPSTVHTGACLFDNETPLSSKARVDVEVFLGQGEPPVIVTLGSAAAQASSLFFAACYAALKSLGLRGLFIMDENHLQQAVSDSDRFMALPYAPYGSIFRRAKAIVCHGGIGTLSQVLRSGRPTLVVPFSHDQPDNAV